MASSGKTHHHHHSKHSEQGHIPHVRLEDETHLQDIYEFGEKLGEGTFGVVTSVQHRQTGEMWASKVINKEKAGTPHIKLLEREVAILKRVKHEHIIKLKEVFETPKKMFLIMEICERGELADVLKEKQKFPERDVKVIIERLAQAISYLHKHGIIHRDIKLENILLSKNPADQSDDLYIKVTDFGLSVVKSGVGIENLFTDFCGTPMYMAPEIIDNKTYGEKCDVWAMGVIAFMLLTGMPPFKTPSKEDILEVIKTANIEKVLKDPMCKDMSTEAKHCIEKMLLVDTAHRFTASEITEHPWITGKDMNTLRQGNVLDMMKDFNMRSRLQMAEDDEDIDDDDNMDGALNGVKIQSVKSASSSRSNSAHSIKKESRRGSLTNVASSKGKKPSSTPAGSSTGNTLKAPNGNTKPGVKPATSKGSVNPRTPSTSAPKGTTDINNKFKKKR